MTPHPSWLARALSRAIPARYRSEVLHDLLDTHRGGARLHLAILRSARDARRQSHTRREESHASGLGTDVRSAWRTISARPTTSLAIVAILGLTIALNTAVASVVDAVLFRPLPFAQADRVQFLWTTSERTARDTLTPARALDFRARVTAFEHAALIGHLSMTVTGRGAAQRWFGASVSSSFFDVLQSPPALGRTFVTADPDRDVIVISHRLWVDQFGADAGVVGSRITMNGRPRTIVGVMPATFYWPSVTSDTSAENPPLFWACAPPPDVPERPRASDEDITRNRTMGFLRMVTRVRADRSVSSAQDEVDAVAAALATEYPATDAGRGAVLVPAHEQLFGPVTRPMWFVLMASALVVFAACVNVGGLLLVRQAGRRREFAVRTALGAGRPHLVRLLVIEAFLLAITAAAVGVLLARSGLSVLVATAPDSIGRLDQVAINGRVLLGSLGISVVAAVLLGAVSAVALWRDRSADALRGAGTAEPSRAGLRSIMVGAQVALAVTLLVGASLFGQSLWRLQRVDVGLKPDRLLTFDLLLTGARAEADRQQLDFYSAMFERLQTLPGVTRTSGALTLPIGGDDFGASALPEGRPWPAPGQSRRIGFQVIWDRWFDTLGMQITAGRDFTPGDRLDTEPVVIINEVLASLEWPGVDPIGRRLKYARDENAPWLTVVGIVSDVRHSGPGHPARPELYLPYRQMPQGMMAVAVRTEADPMLIVPAVRAAVADIDPSQPVSGVSTMNAHLDKAYGRARFLAQLTIVFAGVAGLLTMVGVYGVTSVSVAQRTREFGVRAALGANPRRLASDVLSASLIPVWCGLGAGLCLALGTGHLAQALLFGTTPRDPWAFVAATVATIIAALVASAGPARRASSIDPVITLRGE